MKNVISDRLACNTIQLKNGHVLNHHTYDVPITECHALLPIGHQHSIPEVKNMDHGYVHFLEHMCLLRSEMYPTKETYDNIIAESGAYQNAYVTDAYTDFYLRSPAISFPKVFPGFIDHIAKPLFHANDIAQQRTIIQNEAKQNKYYPGTDPISRHIKGKWLRSYISNKKQVFGSKESLGQITTNRLSTIHDKYFNQPIHFFIGGKCNIHNVIATLEKLRKVDQRDLLPPQPLKLWRPLPFHTINDNTSDAYTIYLGAKQDTWDLNDLFGVSFILDLLTDEDVGVLQRWVRHDTGWSYGVESTFEFSKNNLLWYLRIPVNSQRVVETVRKKINEIIHTATTNSRLIAQSRQKQKLQLAFAFETLTERIDYLIFIHQSLGYLPTETTYLHWLDKVATETLVPVYKKFFAPDVVGEFCTLPK